MIIYQMLQNYTTYRILQLFFDSPTKLFQLREISRLINVSLPSVINHVKKLEKEGFIKREKKGVYESYTANKTDRFKLYRRSDILIRLYESGLIEYLDDELSPSVIVLFGSASRGEDIEDSDIDLFILAKEEDLDLKKYEKKLKRKIEPFFEEKIKDIPKELLNNINNGIVLKGYLKVLE